MKASFVLFVMPGPCGRRDVGFQDSAARHPHASDGLGRGTWLTASFLRGHDEFPLLRSSPSQVGLARLAHCWCRSRV